MEMETVCRCLWVSGRGKIYSSTSTNFREYVPGIFLQPCIIIKVQPLTQHALWTTVSRRRCFPSWCVILQPSRICCAAFCLHLLACWANSSRKSSFWLTWYILKGMYLKPPSSVEYSISFLFMAQNWSNLSVTRQNNNNNKKKQLLTVLMPLLFFQMASAQCAEYQKLSCFWSKSHVLHEKVLWFGPKKSIQIILGLSQDQKTPKHTYMTVSSLLCYQNLTQTRGASPSEPSATANCQRVNFGLFATWNQCVVVLDLSHDGSGWIESFQKHLNISNSPTAEFKLSVRSQIERISK